MSDTHTATVLLVVTVREADTGPEGLMTVNTGTVTMSCCSVILSAVAVVFGVSWK